LTTSGPVYPCHAISLRAPSPGPIEVGTEGPDEPLLPELDPFDELLPQPEATAIADTTAAARARRTLML
jgi:hypothetical protein